MRGAGRGPRVRARAGRPGPQPPPGWPPPDWPPPTCSASAAARDRGLCGRYRCLGSRTTTRGPASREADLRVADSEAAVASVSAAGGERSIVLGSGGGGARGLCEGACHASSTRPNAEGTGVTLATGRGEMRGRQHNRVGVGSLASAGGLVPGRAVPNPNAAQRPAPSLTALLPRLLQAVQLRQVGSTWRVRLIHLQEIRNGASGGSRSVWVRRLAAAAGKCWASLPLGASPGPRARKQCVESHGAAATNWGGWQSAAAAKALVSTGSGND